MSWLKKELMSETHEEKEILILDFMLSNTSYLKEELAHLSELPLSEVITQLKKLDTEGKIELTDIDGHEFWSKK